MNPVGSYVTNETILLVNNMLMQRHNQNVKFSITQLRLMDNILEVLDLEARIVAMTLQNVHDEVRKKYDEIIDDELGEAERRISTCEPGDEPDEGNPAGIN
jgi:hypothetical protein